MKNVKYCPNCGLAVEKGAAFCQNCGASLNPPEKRASRTGRKESKKQKRIIAAVALALLAFAGYYLWGSSQYSKDKQVDWIMAALVNPDEDAMRYIVADSATLAVNHENLAPLQNFYKEHQTAANRMGQNFKAGDNKYGDFCLIQSGHYAGIFPKYKLQVRTYQPAVVTNHEGSQVTVNGEKIGKLTSKGENAYTKRLGLLFPGKYRLKVTAEVEGRKLSASSTVNINSDDTINLNISTKTFTVKSVPNGVVYVDGQNVGSLDDSGELILKDYPVTKNMSLYVAYQNGDNVVQSSPVTDLGSAFEEASEGYDTSDAYYSDLASDESSETVTTQGDGYLVQPKWTELVGKSFAESLFDRNYNDPDPDRFVGGSSNSGYQLIKQENNRWDESDKILSYSQTATVSVVYPLSETESQVIYRIDYSFIHESDVHEQIFEYSGVVEKSGSEYLIQSLGGARKISDTTTDD